MAKNTSKKSAKKKNSFFKKMSSLKWYTKLLLLITVSLLAFLVFKEGVNRYNISLLDQAETKMRAMDLPKADHTEYKRSCSFRSVKFGSAGSPMCDVQRRDKYVSRSDEEVLKKIETIMANQRSDTTIVQLKEDIENTSFLKMEPGFNIEGLYCSQQLSYSKISFEVTESNNSLDLLLTTTCGRRFLFQTYPEI